MYFRCRLSTRALPGPPTIFPKCQHPAASPTAATDPVDRRYPCSWCSSGPRGTDPVATTQSLWEHLSYGTRLFLVTHQLHLQGRTPSATLLNSLILSRIIRSPIGSKSSTLIRRAMARCVSSLSAGHWPCHQTSWRATPRTSIPPFQTSRSRREIVDYI